MGTLILDSFDLITKRTGTKAGGQKKRRLLPHSSGLLAVAPASDCRFFSMAIDDNAGKEAESIIGGFDVKVMK